MALYGLLIDYYYCSGCRSCELACQAAHGAPPEQSGLKLSVSGPFRFPSGRAETYHIPTPTAFCDRCAGSDAPACVGACPFDCIAFGELQALGKRMAEKKMALFTLVE